MADINNPFLNRIVNEEVRPMAERARNLFFQAQANNSMFSNLLSQLSEFSDSDIIVDERADISPLTVGNFRNVVELLSELVTQINQDPKLADVLACCVRGININ